MARIDSFLRLVSDQQASDLHFHGGSVPAIRAGGEIVRLPFRSLSTEEARRLILEMLTPNQRAELDERQTVDFVYVLEGAGRFRANIFVQKHGLSAVFRVVPTSIPSLDSLGLPPSVRRLTRLANGLVLVTGPTGAGKTTTLASMIDEINRTSARHIITLEDPIEFVHEPKMSFITQRQIGLHAESFSAGLRAALRESPDVLVLGEMRDEETVTMALSAAETGALVIGTLHTRSAAKALNRIIDTLPEQAQHHALGVLASVLRGVIAQRLCRSPRLDTRVGVFEVLLQSYAVSHLMREGKVFQIEGYLDSANVVETGMQSLDTHLFALVREERVALEDALRLARNPEQLRQRVAALQTEE